MEETDGAADLVVGPCPDVPLTVLPPSDDWLTEHHRQLRETTIDTAAGPLWKAALLHCPSRPTASSHRANLHLSFCHSIADGASVGLLVGQLLKNLDSLADGRELDASRPVPVSASVDEFAQKERLKLSPGLVRNLLQLLQVLLRRRQHPFLERFVAPFDPALPADSYYCQKLPETLSQQESKQLRAMCRRHGVTMNAALSAAVSLAGARLLTDACSEASPEVSLPVSLPTMWSVDARRYLPEARGLQLSAVSALFSNVQVDNTGGKEFWRVAGRIRDRLNDQLEHRLPLVLLQLAVRFLKPEKIRASMEKPPEVSQRSTFIYNINNLGSLDAVLPKTTHVRAAELHGSFRAHPAMDNSFGSHRFRSVGGRLYYDLNFLRGRVREEDARRFQEEVMRVLRSVAEAGDDDGGQ